MLTVAKVAGIMAAKRTSELIPLCHPIALTQVDLSFSIVEEQSRIDIECVTRTEDRTGVEMEALIGASVAATTIYDMCKAVDRGMVIGDIRLLEKTGGKEDYVRPTRLIRGRAGRRRRGRVPRLSPSPCPPFRGPAPWWRSTSARPRASARRPSPEVIAARRARHRGRRPRRSLAPPGEPAGPGIHRQDGGEGPQRRPRRLRREHHHQRHRGGGAAHRHHARMGEALVEVTQIGKECHTRCAIYYQAGDCVMPREGIFVRVLRGGRVAPGDPVKVRAWGYGG